MSHSVEIVDSSQLRYREIFKRMLLLFTVAERGLMFISPEINKISDSNGICSHNHLVRKRTLNHLAIYNIQSSVK